MAKYCLIFISVLLAGTSFAQKRTDRFFSIHGGGRSSLTMLTDSTVVQRLVQHVGPILETIYKCRSTDSTIEILQQLSPLPEYRNLQAYDTFGSYKAGDIFTKVDGGLIYYPDSLFYVSASNYRRDPDLIYMIDGKKYRQDMGKTDGNGIFRRDPKTNRALQRKIQSLYFTENNYTIDTLNAIQAYQRYGIEAVYGVIVVNTTK